MTLRNQTITDFAAGGDFRLHRFYTVPAGHTITGAELIVRSSKSDLTASSLVLSKPITLVSNANGHIIDAGVSGTAELSFILSPDDTQKLKTPAKFYWIWVTLDNGDDNNPEDGAILAVPGGR